MQVIFRSPLADSSETAPSGELHLKPTDATAADTRQLSLWVLDHGIDSLVRGDGPVQRVVVQHDPTLDDMLAAMIVERQLNGEVVPEGLRRFANYAALAREGLNPGSIPPEQSLAGLFQVVRVEYGSDLTQPEVARQFLELWRKMARRIEETAEQGIDPARTPLFEESEDFARQRIYLREDHRVYLQQDVPGGERWQVKLPGGPPESQAVVLRQPKSHLFKFWSRAEGNLLAVVEHKPGEWVITTDPIQKLSLKDLAGTLQKAELAKNAAAEDDPWYDGARFQHTLVAAPRSGTKLSDKEVLRVVRRWSHARQPATSTEPRRPAALVAPALVAILLVGSGVAFWEWWKKPDVLPQTLVAGYPTNTVRSFQVLPEPDRHSLEQAATLRGGDWSTVSFSVDNSLSVLRNVVLTATVAATDGSPLQVDRIRFNVNSAAGSELPLTTTSTPQRRQSGSHQALFDGGSNLVQVAIQNPGAEVPCNVTLQWEVESVFHGNLYVVPIGVSTYQNSRSREGDMNLPYADDDALAIHEFFLNNPPGLFKQVPPIEPLIDDRADENNILVTLGNLRPTPNDLVIITISGHGDVDNNGNYFFLPYDYDPTKPEKSRIYWEDLKGKIKNYQCLVVLVMDTCHSGTVTQNLRNAGDPQSAMQKAASEAVELFNQSKKGLVVVAATLGDLPAEEVRAGGGDKEEKLRGHGALTLALLEALEGRRLYTGPLHDGKQNAQLPCERDPDKLVLTLKDIIDYAVDRVPQLTTRPQAVIPNHSGDIDYRRIPITMVRRSE